MLLPLILVGLALFGFVCGFGCGWGIGYFSAKENNHDA